ncbi:MAG: hypothetical protein KIT84_15020 [Labilithrix sp.]|nr:hypothetical protein [Labilithrix sp.]MCW5812335.1 hypothetical protein [Labilithrix sp.]
MNRVLALASAVVLLLTPALAHADDGDLPAEEPAPAPTPAPPAPAPSAPAPAETPAPVRPQRQIPVGVRADGGYGLRALEKLPVSGADLGLAVGAQPGRHFAFWGEFRLFLGSTENGLGVKSGRFNFDLDIVIDRLRITLDPGIFVVGVDRATKNQTIVSWGPKLGAAARLDVLQSESFALFARAAIEGGPTFADGSLFGGFTFGGGIDFDIKRGDRSSL